MKFRFFLYFSLLFSSGVLFADDDNPRSLDPEIKIELFAEQPQIVTPTGLDVDHKGRVWAIESNTHFPPEGYSGHPTDRILVMQDTNGDGKADKIVTFTDGLTHTMSIAVKPVWLKSPESRVQSREKEKKSDSPQSRSLDSQLSTLDIFVATRRDIFLFHDDDGDLKADRKKRIIRLETRGNYPHNGLAGFAFDAMGWMYFGFGENLGADYKIIGSDGTTLSGGGEGGHIYRCRPDGTKLKQWATGFWNPHASCMDAFGRLFTVDNDPDSRPPCRLLHIIEGGDYGYRFSNGRKGLHPFTAWNGEIPGTLPMVSGTGEAPSGIVAYESDGLPKKYIGNLLVTSWGDHRIDRFVLEPKGASFQSRPETIIQGGENFRPVGLAVAPDGSLYCTDWVLKDYKLHGHGRIWRISAKDEPKRKVIDTATITPKTPIEQLKKMLASPRLDVRRVSAGALRKSSSGRKQLLAIIGDEKQPARQRIEALWALAKVPVQVENFDFMRSKHGQARIACELDAVGVAAYSLLGTPQFPFRNVRFLKSCSADPDFGNLALHDKLRNPEVARLLLAQLRSTAHLDKFGAGYVIAIDSGDPFLLGSFLNYFPDSLFTESSFKEFIEKDPLKLIIKTSDPARRRLAWLLVSRRMFPQSVSLAVLGLKDADPAVRRAAVQWVGEEGLKKLRPQVEAILNDRNMTTDLFLATLAALEMLDGKSPKDFDKTPPAKYVLPLVKDDKRSPAVRAQALRLVSPDDPSLNEKLLSSLLRTDDPQLKQETVRTLQHSSHKFAGKLMLAVAADDKIPAELRAEAVAGLYGRWFNAENSSEITQTLAALTKSEKMPLKLEAIRTTRTLLVKTAQGRATRTALLRSLKSALEKDPDILKQEGIHRRIAEQLVLAMTQSRIRLPDILKPILADRPTSNDDWYKQVLDGKGNTAAGRRIFFHANAGGCYKCHTVNGRGGNVGPDLSSIGRGLSRKRLVESIIEPSKEIAPQFTNWTFVMESGKVHHGMILGDTRDDIQQIGTAEGTVVSLNAKKIELRQPQKTSVMPEKLAERLTVSEFRDLLAFLESLK